MTSKRPATVLASPLGLRRREFLAALLASSAVAACGSGGRSSPVVGGRASEKTPFPENIPLYQEDYENWTREIRAEALPTCAPRNPDDVVQLANWAFANDFQVRPRGMRHGWSPLSISMGTTAQASLVVVDTTQNLNRVELIEQAGLPAVRVEAGVLVEDLMEFLDEHNYGFTGLTAVGEITIAGALAINGHGSAVPAVGESPLPQQTFGSLSNRIMALSAVVWDASQQRYQLREFDRTDPDIGALLTQLGRAFITEFTLALEPNHKLRCVSRVDIPASEMFGPPGSGGRDIASFLDSAGRIESIWYPFTENPWLKIWSVSPDKPLLSREVHGPYNYPFSDNLPDAVTGLAQQLVSGNPEVAPLFGQTLYAVTVAGLTATLSLDLWGSAKDTLMFVKPTTLRVHEFSYAALTRRDQVQRVIHEFSSEYRRRLEAHREQGRYPVNMPVEFRVTGLDHADDIGLPGAQAATLSTLHPRADRPDWDTAVWLSVLTIPGTPDAFPFFRELEQRLYDRFDGEYASIRPEWSKGWAYTNDAAWADAQTLTQRIPATHREGRAGAGWDEALRTLARLDPAGIFQNEFLAELLPGQNG